MDGRHVSISLDKKGRFVYVFLVLLAAPLFRRGDVNEEGT
jgi:hypothetical protein